MKIPALLVREEVPGRDRQTCGRAASGELLPAVENSSRGVKGAEARCDWRDWRVINVWFWVWVLGQQTAQLPGCTFVSDILPVICPTWSPPACFLCVFWFQSLAFHAAKVHPQRTSMDSSFYGLKEEFQFSILLCLLPTLVMFSVHSVTVGTGSKRTM